MELDLSDPATVEVVRMSFPRSLLVLLLLVVVAPSLTAQDANTEAYFRMVGGYFDVPPKEILILSEWRLPADEIPVVLFVARRASIPVDAVVAIRRRGSSWQEISRRFGWGAEAFHVPLLEGSEADLLATAYREYRARPRSQWSGIELSDSEIVILVNVRVLSEHLGLPPVRVLAARARTSNFPSALERLMGGR